MESNLKLSKCVELSIEHVSEIVITELYLEQTLLSTLASRRQTMMSMNRNLSYHPALYYE